jgi:hypothetical protein
MNANELESFWIFIDSEAQRLGFDPTNYKLGGKTSLGSGEIAFDYRYEKFCVFLFERGQEEDFSVFDRKRDAVYFFFLMLMINKGSSDYPQINFKNMI